MRHLQRPLERDRDGPIRELKNHDEVHNDDVC